MTLKGLVTNTQSLAKTTAKLYRLTSSETTTYNSIRASANTWHENGWDQWHKLIS